MKRIVFLRADLKETNGLLSRIAAALEIAAGIVQPGPEAKDSDRDVAVAVSTEADLIREEWARALNGEEPTGEEQESVESAFRALVRNLKG